MFGLYRSLRSDFPGRLGATSPFKVRLGAFSNQLLVFLNSKRSNIKDDHGEPIRDAVTVVVYPFLDHPVEDFRENM